MKRLTHSKTGLLRSFDISKARVFAIVEGGLDRVFFDRILEIACKDKFQYEVKAAKDIPGSVGGKAGVVNFFNELKERNALFSTRWGEKKVFIFFADKDIDDYTNKIVTSDHFLYTETYDLEGHLIQCGNLIRALSEATFITTRQAEELIGDEKEFLRNVATACIDWVALCILSNVHEVNAGCGYSMNPPLNLLQKNEFILELDLDTLANRICGRLEWDRDHFDALFDQTKALVKNEIASEFHLKIFKGKWFSDILQKFTTTFLKLHDINLSNVGDRVLQSLVAQVANGKNCTCSKSIFDSINPLLDQVSDA